MICYPHYLLLVLYSFCYIDEFLFYLIPQMHFLKITDHLFLCRFSLVLYLLIHQKNSPLQIFYLEDCKISHLLFLLLFLKKFYLFTE